MVDDKLHHIMVVNLLNTVTWRFDSPDAIDACNLATALLRALRKRSTLALVISLPALADGKYITEHPIQTVKHASVHLILLLSLPRT